MNKTRGLLSLVTLLTIAGQILILNSHLHNNWRFVLHVSDGILLLSAMTMLLFSFFRVGVTPCRELCYNEDNWYWKTMVWFCDQTMDFSNPFYRGEVSLCKAFWLTVFAVFSVIVFLVVAILLIVVIWDAYWKFGLLKMILWTLGFIAAIATVIGTVVGMGIVVDKIRENVKPRTREVMDNVGSVFGTILIVSLSFFTTVVMPIVLIMEKAKVTLGTAIIYYLIDLVGLALVVGGAWLLIWGLFWYLPKVMEGSVLTEFLSAGKKKFCPILIACKIR